MEKYDTQEVFDKYKEDKDLKEADIFHIYDTDKECIVDNSGYYDSRHFRLVAFNTITMTKRDLGIHGGVTSMSKDTTVDIIRVYADGSFFIKFQTLIKVNAEYQDVMIN